MPRRGSDAKLAIEATEFLRSRRSSSSSNDLRKAAEDETESEKDQMEEREAEFNEDEEEDADEEEEEEEEVVPVLSRSGRSIKKVISAKEELDYIQATTGRKPRDANAKSAAPVRGGRQTKKTVPSATEMSTDSENDDENEEEEEEDEEEKEENHRPSNKRNTLDRNELVQAEQMSLTSLSGLRNSLQPFVSRKSFAALESAAMQRPKSNHKNSSSSAGHRRDAKELVENEVEEDGFTAQPDTIKNCTMRSYQLEGLSWLVSHYHRCINCILADEMYVTIYSSSLYFLTYLPSKFQLLPPHLTFFARAIFLRAVRSHTLSI